MSRLVLVICVVASGLTLEAHAAVPPKKAQTPATKKKVVAAVGRAGKAGTASAVAGKRPVGGKTAKGTAKVAAGKRPSIDSATVARPVTDPTDPHEQRIATLRQALAAVLHDSPLSRMRVGVEVMQARDGDVLFAHNHERQFNPASNTKLLTTAAALVELGEDYRYHTKLHGPLPDSDGVVHGDVDLRGSGDPSLSNGDLADLARATAAAGITRIDGSILADGRYRDPANPDQRVGEKAIILNRNAFRVRVIPTSVGHSAVIHVEPEADFYVVSNKVKTVGGKKGTRLKVDVGRSGDKLLVIVKGRVNARSEASVRKRFGEVSLHAAATLRRALIDFGVDVTGAVRVGGLAGSAPVLAEHLSQPMSVICRVSNKDSNNFVAERIFDTVGAVRYGVPASEKKGRSAVADLLTPIGVKPGTYNIVNGSGLTHSNRIAPSGLIQLLRHLYFNLSVAPEFLTTLSIGGVDGTIRGRFRGTDAVGLVRAKTGTLSGVSALSGYVGDYGDVLIFSILVEGIRGKKLAAAREAQVRMVLAMLRYLRADEHRPTRVPPVEPTEKPTEDYEDDGDPALGGAGGR